MQPSPLPPSPTFLKTHTPLYINISHNETPQSVGSRAVGRCMCSSLTGVQSKHKDEQRLSSRPKKRRFTLVIVVSSFLSLTGLCFFICPSPHMFFFFFFFPPSSSPHFHHKAGVKGFFTGSDDAIKQVCIVSLFIEERLINYQLEK